MLGWYLGGGLSFRVSNQAMLDLGIRYQHASDEYEELNLDTTEAGFTYRL